MTNNELITELIYYDDDGDSLLYKTLTSVERMAFLTDMNILHRIAVKVVANISGILDNSEDLDFNLTELNQT